MARRRKQRPKVTPKDGARHKRGAERRRETQTIWMLWSVFVVLLVGAVGFSFMEYRRFHHLHVHVGLVVCDLVTGAFALAATWPRLK